MAGSRAFSSLCTFVLFFLRSHVVPYVRLFFLTFVFVSLCASCFSLRPFRPYGTVVLIVLSCDKPAGQTLSLSVTMHGCKAD